jgi:hypothetical protein
MRTLANSAVRERKRSKTGTSGARGQAPLPFLLNNGSDLARQPDTARTRAAGSFKDPIAQASPLHGDGFVRDNGQRGGALRRGIPSQSTPAGQNPMSEHARPSIAERKTAQTRRYCRRKRDMTF